MGDKAQCSVSLETCWLLRACVQTQGGGGLVSWQEGRLVFLSVARPGLSLLIH